MHGVSTPTISYFAKKIAMKILLFTLFIIWFSHPVFSQNVYFTPGSWEEVLQKAKVENKYIMVDAFTDWCGPCKRMDAEMFQNNVAVADFVNANFVSFKADCEKTPGVAIAMKFKVISYPTLLFFNPQGQLIFRSLGYTADQQVFLEPFRNVLTIKDQKVFGYDSKVLDPGFPAIYTDAFKKDGVGAKRHTADEVVQYLDAQKDKFSEVNWALLYVYSFPLKYEQFFLDNFAKYKSLYQSEASDGVKRIAARHVNASMKNKDEKEFDLAVAMVQQYIPEQADELIIGWKINFYKSNGQWQKYADAIDVELKKDPNVDVDYLNQFCWPIYEHCDDPAVVNRAIEWLGSRSSQMKGYEVIDTYAALLYKANRLDEAETYALKAIAACPPTDCDPTGTNELLVKIRAAKTKSPGNN